MAFYASEHASQVRRAYLLVRSNELANDIVHDAMVGVWRRWPLENPAGYLSRSVLNGCRDAGRRRVSRADLLGRLRTDPVDSQPSEHLDDVLMALPFNQRAAVVLRFYCGWSTKEIAAAMDCPANSVGPWITRGLERMRRELS
ncbi:MAG: sigma-70 family RNA polymerase sigma factor [Ilumatobacter sp.]|nr:sigma-70 family RNA polymerase sigma factor [Ilumatobacter sp.]